MANEIESGRLPQGAVSRSTPATLALPQPLSALLAAQVNLELATAAIFVLQADARGGHAAGRRAALVASISTGPFACAPYAGWSCCCRALLCVLRMFVVTLVASLFGWPVCQPGWSKSISSCSVTFHRLYVMYGSVWRHPGRSQGRALAGAVETVF